MKKQQQQQKQQQITTITTENTHSFIRFLSLSLICVHSLLILCEHKYFVCARSCVRSSIRIFQSTPNNKSTFQPFFSRSFFRFCIYFCASIGTSTFTHTQTHTLSHPPHTKKQQQQHSHNNFRNDSEQYRDYETVFIIPGPSQMKNRKTLIRFK